MAEHLRPPESCAHTWIPKLVATSPRRNLTTTVTAWCPSCNLTRHNDDTKRPASCEHEWIPQELITAEDGSTLGIGSMCAKCGTKSDAPAPLPARPKPRPRPMTFAACSRLQRSRVIAIYHVIMDRIAREISGSQLTFNEDELNRWFAAEERLREYIIGPRDE